MFQRFLNISLYFNNIPTKITRNMCEIIISQVQDWAMGEFLYHSNKNRVNVFCPALTRRIYNLLQYEYLNIAKAEFGAHSSSFLWIHRNFSVSSSLLPLCSNAIFRLLPLAQGLSRNGAGLYFSKGTFFWAHMHFTSVEDKQSKSERSCLKKKKTSKRNDRSKLK